jgi:carbamoyltransferase
VPAITHVDGTARIQTVRRQINPLYYDLISNLEKLNGVPMVLNTSFNLRGEPIVDSPDDAIKTFSWSDMDYLVLGRHLLKKEWLT